MYFYFVLSRVSKVDMTNTIVESTANFVLNETWSLGETVSTQNIFACFFFEIPVILYFRASFLLVVNHSLMSVNPCWKIFIGLT